MPAAARAVELLASDFGADFAAPRGSDRTTPLMVMAAAGHTVLIRAACPTSPAPGVNNTRPGDGATALYLAAASGHAAAVAALLRAGAEVDKAATGDGEVNRTCNETPLFAASQHGHGDVVDALLAAGADVDARRGTDGASALVVAAIAGHVAIVRTLAGAGADLEATTHAGGGALFLAALDGQADVVRTLIDSNADVDARGNAVSAGATPISAAAFRGSAECVSALAAAGAKLDAGLPGDGRTPLFMAVLEGHEAAAAALLDRKADPDRAANDGATPLFMAVLKSQVNLIKLLVKHGADPQATTARGDTVMKMAAKRHPDVMDALWV